MTNLYINSSGTFVEPNEIFIKNGGSWQTVKEVWIKNGGTWNKSYPSTGTVTYTSGSGSFVVPPGIYEITVSYPTTAGITTSNVSVTPGQSVAYNIGGFGSASTFGSINTGVWDQVVATFSGNVDAVLYVDWGVLTAGGNTYSGSGNAGTLSAGAASAGCYYNEYNEGSHGDLTASITINTALSSTILNSIQVYLSAFSGRGYYTIPAQPTSGNSYRATIVIYDGDYSEGSYSYTMNLQQSVPFTVNW